MPLIYEILLSDGQVFLHRSNGSAMRAQTKKTYGQMDGRYLLLPTLQSIIIWQHVGHLLDKLFSFPKILALYEVQPVILVHNKNATSPPKWKCRQITWIHFLHQCLDMLYLLLLLFNPSNWCPTFIWFSNNLWVAQIYGLRYAKRSLMSWVIVIPKEGRARGAAPALLLVWHRLFQK